MEYDYFLALLAHVYGVVNQGRHCSSSILNIL